MATLITRWRVAVLAALEGRQVRSPDASEGIILPCFSYRSIPVIQEQLRRGVSTHERAHKVVESRLHIHQFVGPGNEMSKDSGLRGPPHVGCQRNWTLLRPRKPKRLGVVEAPSEG